MRTPMPPSTLLRFLSDDSRLKLLVTWLSCLVASIAGASAIQLGIEARYVVPVSVILMIVIFVVLGVGQVRRQIGFSGKGSSSGRALLFLPATKELQAARSETAEGRARLQHFFEEIGATVKPYPPIDLHVSADLSRGRAMSKGAVRTMSYTVPALLVGVTVYGMITNDRGILLAVLQVLRYSGLALLAWSLGKVIGLPSDVRGRGRERAGVMKPREGSSPRR
jgi:hypothetical protein